NGAIHTLRDLNLAVRGPFTNMRRQRIYVIEDCILTESEILRIESRRQTYDELYTRISGSILQRKWSKQSFAIGLMSWSKRIQKRAGAAKECYSNWALSLQQRFLDADRARYRQGKIDLKVDGKLVNLLSADHSTPGASGKHSMLLEPYGYRWFRIGGLDYLLKRTET